MKHINVDFLICPQSGVLAPRVRSCPTSTWHPRKKDAGRDSTHWLITMWVWSAGFRANAWYSVQKSSVLDKNVILIVFEKPQNSLESRFKPHSGWIYFSGGGGEILTLPLLVSDFNPIWSIFVGSSNNCSCSYLLLFLCLLFGSQLISRFVPSLSQCSASGETGVPVHAPDSGCF